MARRRHWVVAIFWLALAFGLAGLASPPACPAEGGDYIPRYADRPAGAPRGPQYTFAIHPLHNPRRLFTLYQPLIDLLNERVEGFTLKLVASRDYGAFEEKLYAGRFFFALPNPLQTLLSQRHGYRIFGKMAGDDDFRGVIVVRRDAGITSPADLAGAPLSFPARGALAATMMPKYFLRQGGLDLAGNDVRYVGSQESAIMNVYLGRTAAAGTWPLPWKLLIEARPDLAAALEARWVTPPLVNNGLVARRDVPEEHVAQVLAVLVGLPGDALGRKVLRDIGISAFEGASEATYAPVREFLEDYVRLFPEEASFVGGLP